ncbi:MAG: response regulator transcription factor [Acidimicrobiales bacterium]
MISVLLVDDDSDVRGLMEVMLGDNDHFSVVGHARDGAEALRLADLTRAQVIVLDLHMPGMDGYAALPRLRAMLPKARIVVVSAFPDPYTLLDAVQRGADGYIDKSRVWSELLPTLHSLCEVDGD